jgi:4a-hydroxytetrahydrobiopterin dehydratase
MTTVLDNSERTAALAELPGWRYTLSSLHAVYECESVSAALALIQAIGQAAETQDHHPDLDWRSRHVFLRSTTHSERGQVTAKDIDLARAISAAASDVSAQARPELIRVLEIAIDTTDPAAISDTWATALGYRDRGTGDLIDPWSRLPTIWFQKTDTPDPSRIHLDLTVEDSTADAVLADITAHGGRRIEDGFRPSFTVVADAQENRLCICTNLGRD